VEPPKATYSLTVKAGAHGSISPSGVLGSIPAGQSEILTVTPEDGYSLATFMVDGNPASLNGNKYTFSANSGAHTIEATFSQLVTITVILKDPHGTATPMTQQVILGAQASVSFQPTQGWHVDSVWVDGKFAQKGGGSYSIASAPKDGCIIAVSFSDALSPEEVATKSSLLDGKWHLVNQEESFAAIGHLGNVVFTQWTDKPINSCNADDYQIYKKSGNTFTSYVNGTPCTGDGRLDFNITAAWNFSANGTILYLAGKEFLTPTMSVDYSLNSTVVKLTTDSLVLIDPLVPPKGVVIATRKHFVKID
jgi:hypothetical protein